MFDEDQQVAKSYYAACTPDFSVFNPQMQCVYRGQLDDSRPGNNKPKTGGDLRLVLDLVLANNAINFVVTLFSLDKPLASAKFVLLVGRPLILNHFFN